MQTKSFIVGKDASPEHAIGTLQGKLDGDLYPAAAQS